MNITAFVKNNTIGTIPKLKNLLVTIITLCRTCFFIKWSYITCYRCSIHRIFKGYSSIVSRISINKLGTSIVNIIKSIWTSTTNDTVITLAIEIKVFKCYTVIITVHIEPISSKINSILCARDSRLNSDIPFIWNRGPSIITTCLST